MRSRSATELLLLPVQLHGIRLGRPVDLLLDQTTWRAIGFVLLCGDESERFLAYAAADLTEDAIVLPSALLLLEDVDFYRDRSRSLRGLIGSPVRSRRREVGELADVLLARSGIVASLVVGRNGDCIELEPAGATVESERVSAA
jgi:hypothetical protein